MKLTHVAFVVTLKCTLNCKLCSQLIPYVSKEKPYIPTFEVLKRDLDRLFECVDSVFSMNVTGGEPLLRGGVIDTALFDICDYLSEIPDEKLTQFRIYTSGTVVPNDELCEHFKKISSKKSFWLEIDNYGRNSFKLTEMTNKLKQYGIKYNVRDYSEGSETLYCDGWVDFRHSPTKIHDENQAKIIFDKCACGGDKTGRECVGFFDGVLVTCPATSTRYVCGEIDKNHEEVIDLYDDDKAVRAKHKKVQESAFWESCLYCQDGVCHDSKRYTPAQQALKEDVSEFQALHPKMRY